MNHNSQNEALEGQHAARQVRLSDGRAQQAGDKPDQPSRPLDPREPPDRGRLPGINAPEMPDPNSPPQPEKEPNPLDYPDGQQAFATPARGSDDYH
jgi:hypothetical protein